MPSDRTYSPGDLAARYACKPETICAMIARGDIAAVNIGLGTIKPRWRVTQAALDRFEAARAAKSAPATTRRRRRKKPHDYRNYFAL